MYHHIKKCPKPAPTPKKVTQGVFDDSDFLDEEGQNTPKPEEKKEESEPEKEEESVFAKYYLGDEIITNLVVSHEAQMERLASGKYVVATA